MLALVVMLTLSLPTASPERVSPERVSPGRVVRSFPSTYGTVYVVDEGDTRALRFDDPDAADQSVMSISRPRDVTLEYVRVAALALALTKQQPKKVLVIGMGGGTFTRLVRDHVKGAVTDSVEIDPVVVDVAMQYFELKPDARTRVHIADGAAFLAEQHGKYDVILLDAYDGEDIPAHLATEPFFQLVKQRLDDGGVAVLNLALEDDALSAQVFGRYAAVFEGCLRVREPSWGNVLVFGKHKPFPDGPALLMQSARTAERSYALPFKLEGHARRATDCAAPITAP